MLACVLMLPCPLHLLSACLPPCPPACLQACIMAVGGSRSVAVMRDGQPASKSQMTVTLSGGWVGWAELPGLLGVLAVASTVADARPTAASATPAAQTRAPRCQIKALSPTASALAPRWLTVRLPPLVAC